MKRKTVNKQLTIEGRLFIEERLNENVSVTKIANMLHRDRSGISREINNHSHFNIPTTFGETKNCNYCIKRKECQHQNRWGHNNCQEFELEICSILKSSPHVCNGCGSKNKCRKARRYYKGLEANLQYEELLKKSRSNLHYTELELEILNTDFYFLVKNTCSTYHSLRVINGLGYKFAKPSIYRQIKNDNLRLKPSDLPRTAPKKSKRNVNKDYKRNIEGHTLEDFIVFKNNNPKAIEWQMDCVQGITGSDQQVFLTLQIVKIKFLFIFIMSNQTAEKVKITLQEFKNNITEEVFNDILNILLTDNGHEFINLEYLIEVCPSTNIFYCHPYSSYEKGSIENNHGLIRRCIPQGVSLNIYTQDDINSLTSNINSLYREDLNGKCPFDLVSEFISLDILNKLGLEKIEDKNVNVSSYLLGDKNIANIKKWLSEEEIKKAHISLN